MKDVFFKEVENNIYGAKNCTLQLKCLSLRGAKRRGNPVYTLTKNTNDAKLRQERRMGGTINIPPIKINDGCDEKVAPILQLTYSL